jgi:predicted  nucleic acid-binding Zn-ribbon protein
VRLHVTETEPGETRYQLSNSNDSQLTFILKQTGDNTAFEAALQPIFEARRHVADMQTELDKVDEHINTLHSDEERQRANVTALENSDKSSRERFVRDLNATEDQITAAQKDLTAAQANLQTANDDLEDKIESLQIDETL